MRASISWALAALLFIAGCSKDKDVEPPAKLVNFPHEASGERNLG